MLNKLKFSILMSLMIFFCMSNVVFADVYQYYPTDYASCYMPYHDYQPDDFCYASGTPSTQGKRDAQTYYAKRIFQVAYNTSSDPNYQNMWGTYSSSGPGAHEGIDMYYYSNAPIRHWGSTGRVIRIEPSIGLIAIYCSDIHETIFYRHMYNVSTSINVGDTIYHNQQIGNEGDLGRADGTHLHCGVEWGEDTTDTVADSYFCSNDIYYAMQFFGY